MGKRHFTVFVISDDSSKTKQYKIPVKRYRFVRNALVVLVLLVTYLSIDYGSMVVKTRDYTSVKQENASQKVDLDVFSMKLNDFEQQVARLQVFDKRLRILANLEVPGELGTEAMGKGGADLEGGAQVSLAEKRQELVKQMHTDFDALQARAADQEKSYAELETVLGKQSSLLASTPSVWPARGWVSSKYGKRRSPFTGKMERHTGLDIANRLGTAIVATANGRVVYVGKKSALGRAVVISHGYGMKSTFGHLSKTLVKKGQKVKRGDKIAEMGNTGRSTGPHLHYDISKNGMSVNPMNYILN